MKIFQLANNFLTAENVGGGVQLLCFHDAAGGVPAIQAYLCHYVRQHLVLSMY